MLFRIDVDLTERRKAEEALVHSARMAAVGTLAGGVAHEFNNVHGAALGYLELALREEMNPKLRGYIESTHDAISRAADVTHELLAFSGKDKAEREASLLASASAFVTPFFSSFCAMFSALLSLNVV